MSVFDKEIEKAEKKGYKVEHDYSGDSDNFERFLIKDNKGRIIQDEIYAYRLLDILKKLPDLNKTPNEELADKAIKNSGLVGFSSHEIDLAREFARGVAIKVAEEKDKKLTKMKRLADNMYNGMQYLSTDLSQLRKAMEEYHNFIIHEYNE